MCNYRKKRKKYCIHFLEHRKHCQYNSSLLVQSARGKIIFLCLKDHAVDRLGWFKYQVYCTALLIVRLVCISNCILSFDTTKFKTTNKCCFRLHWFCRVDRKYMPRVGRALPPILSLIFKSSAQLGLFWNNSSKNKEQNKKYATNDTFYSWNVQRLFPL